jgi:hypothetical protein
VAANPKIEDILTSEKPAKGEPELGPMYNLGPNVIGELGQIFGQFENETYQPNQEQLRVAAQQFHGLSAAQWDNLSAEQKAQAIDSFTKSGGVSSYLTGETTTKADKTLKAAKKAAADPKAQGTALQQLANLLTQGYAQQGEVAMGQLGQQLAQQNAAVTGTVASFIGGGGVSSGNPAVDAAMGAYAKAYGAGEGINSAAYQNMGLANQAYLAAAPSQPVLGLLTQLGSGQYKELPSSLVQNLPPSIQYALQQAGITEIQPGQSGGTPVPNPVGGWPKSITRGSAGGPTAGSLASILGGLNLNNAPGTNPNINPGGTTGNPSTPGNA